MERFVKASMKEYARLFIMARRGFGDIAEAAYPPTCDREHGRLTFKAADAGGLIMRVDRCGIETDDFRLRVLFETGSYVFGDPLDLGRFFRGPVAAAFGIAAEPLPEPTPEAVTQPRSEVVRVPDVRPKTESPTSVTPGVATNGAPTANDLARQLARNVRGQHTAVNRIAAIVAAHLAKRAPARPESLLLIGDTGTGKTSSIEALPAALDDLGASGFHVFRIDCNELTHDYDVHRFLGAAPGLVGFTSTPPFIEALQRPGCIILLDEIEKAHEAVRTVFLGLLDEGRVTAPDGTAVHAPGVVVAMTTNVGANDLGHKLRQAPAHDRWRQTICRDHLVDAGWAREFVGRIGAFAAFEPLADDSLREVARTAVSTLAREYGLEIESVPDVVLEVVLDLAHESDLGARAVNYAARDLLSEAFAHGARCGLDGRMSIDPGPPPSVVPVGGSIS